MMMIKVCTVMLYFLGTYIVNFHVDIEFWRMPSRRFYVARAADFEEIQKTVKRKKMSLKRKHYVDLTTDTDDTSPQLGRIEDTIKKVHTQK